MYNGTGLGGVRYIYRERERERERVESCRLTCLAKEPPNSQGYKQPGVRRRVSSIITLNKCRGSDSETTASTFFLLKGLAWGHMGDVCIIGRGGVVIRLVGCLFGWGWTRGGMQS